MSLLEEIEHNFSSLDGYKLTNNQNNFLIDFIENGNKYSLFVDKDLKCIYIESPTVNTDQININLIHMKKMKDIFDILVFDFIKKGLGKNKRKKTNDEFGIFRQRDVFNKGGCNFLNLKKKLVNSQLSSELSISSIPKNLLYSRKQIIEIIVNEIKMTNSDKSHPHYISLTEEDYIFNMHLKFIDRKLEVLL